MDEARDVGVAANEVPEEAVPPQEAVLSPQEKEKVYTVDEAINKMGFGPFQVLITVFAGGLWMADSMEVMILSVLSPAIKCQWSLSRSEEALVTSIVFLGFFCGGFIWGVVFDAAGRKTGLFIVNVSFLIFGILSAIPVSSDDSKIPGFPWLLACRFGVGFAAGGSGQAVTYYTEFLPLKIRGGCMVLLDVWSAFGVIFGSILAVLVLGLGDLSWHWYLGLAACPLALVSILFLFVPESARFYLVKGKNDKAQKVIERIAWYNFTKAPPGRVVLKEDKDEMAVHEEAVLYSQGTVMLPDSSQISSYDIASDSEEEDNALLLDSPDMENEKTVPLIFNVNNFVHSQPVAFLINISKNFLSLFSRSCVQPLQSCCVFGLVWPGCIMDLSCSPPPYCSTTHTVALMVH